MSVLTIPDPDAFEGDGPQIHEPIRDASTSFQRTVSTHASVRNADGILATATSPTGGRLMGPITDDCRVEVQGCEMRVSDAVRLGYVTKNTDGTFGNVAESEQPHNATPETPTLDTSESIQIDPEVSETLTNWSGALDAFGANPAGVLGEVLTNPDEMPEALTGLAREQGVDVGALQKEVSRISTDVEKGLGDYLQSAGVPADKLPDYWEYINETQGRGSVAAAFIQMLRLGDASPFKSWAQSFMRSSG